MRAKLLPLFKVILFNLMCIALMSSVVLYRTDSILAQGDNGKSGDAALVPRSMQAAESQDDDDDADGDAGDDPPTDNDGTDSDGIDTTGDQDDPEVTYTIRAGDTLMRVAARLGIPYAVLKAQDATPSLIHPGQKFVYRASEPASTRPSR